MQHALKHLTWVVVLSSFSALAAAQGSAVGLWKTIDDKTHKEKSLVRLSENGGVLTGKIEKLLDPAAEAQCSKCGDDRKDKPMVGLEIVRGLKKEASGDWEGGTIIDPKDGKIYKVKVMPQADGKTVLVRGYIGPFFRTQTWHKAD